MSRIRTVKPQFFINEDLYDIEEETGLPVRLAFIGLWTQADREGRFKWKVRELKAAILPHDNVDLSRVLDALATRGFVLKYTVNERHFGMIPGFAEHQFINNKEPASNLPEPIENVEELARIQRDGNACAARDEHVPIGREGKGKEGDKKKNTPYSEKRLDDDIDTVFEHYNAVAGTMPCWTKARDCTDKRVKAVRARIRDRFKTPEALCAYITQASETGFLSRDDHDTWNCSLDFLLKPETIRKVTEGQYGQAKPTAKTLRSHADSERDIWSWRLDQWHKSGLWEDRWGPPPDHEMSHVPRDLLKETRH